MRDLIRVSNIATGMRASPCSKVVKAGLRILAGRNLVPVPLYRSRLWSRQFSQSALRKAGD
jgi:predicted amidophosphoribosyltransferase